MVDTEFEESSFEYIFCSDISSVVVVQVVSCDSSQLYTLPNNKNVIEDTVVDSKTLMIVIEFEEICFEVGSFCSGISGISVPPGSSDLFNSNSKVLTKTSGQTDAVWIDCHWLWEQH